MQDSMLLAPHGAHTVLVPGYLVPERLAQGFRLLWELPADPAARTLAMLDTEAAHRGAQAFLAEHPGGFSYADALVKEETGEQTDGSPAATPQPALQAPRSRVRKGGK